VSDEPRRRILERRARFVTAAIASAGLAACRPCLSMVPPDGDARVDAGEADATTQADAAAQVDAASPDTGSPPPPVPCLSPMIADTGTQDTLTPDAGSQGSMADVGPAPMPCLKIAPPKHPPKACLDVPFEPGS